MKKQLGNLPRIITAIVLTALLAVLLFVHFRTIDPFQGPGLLFSTQTLLVGFFIVLLFFTLFIVGTYDLQEKMYNVYKPKLKTVEGGRPSHEIPEKNTEKNKGEVEMFVARKYDELIDNMPNLFFAFDRQLRYTYVNKAYEKFTGIKADQAVGYTMAEVFPGRTPLFMEEYNEVLKNRMPKSFTSAFMFNENSVTFFVNIHPTDTGFSVLMTDLTEQKKQEEEAKEKIERLQRKNQDLQQFAYIATHNLRTPIAKILGLVSLFENDPSAQINDSTLLECVENEVKNLDNVVKDMNTIVAARESDGHQKDLFVFRDEFKLIEQVLENQITESKAIITTDFHNPESVMTVKSYMYSILYNLLSNAIKYRTPQVPLMIHLNTEQDNKFICLHVKDNGMGIDLEKNGDKLFGMYKRFHGNGIEGKGIGLTLVKAQTESLGGRVEVESKPNRGTTFKVFIPKN